jgi:hypothetical protein
MKSRLSSVLALMSAASLANQSLAGQGDIGPVFIESIAVIALPAGGHLAGNMEVKIKGGFVIPSGVSCDGTYITTLKSVDVDKRLFALLTIAQATKQAVTLRITDDPSLSAFAGRCSLVWVFLAP